MTFDFNILKRNYTLREKIYLINQNFIEKQKVKDAILKYFNTTLLKLASSERLAEQRDLLLKELEMYKTQM